jgi:hypothetical protein
MRRILLTATLATAATLCACDEASNRNPSAPTVSAIALPSGFALNKSSPSDQGVLDLGGRFIVENRTGHALDARLEIRDWGDGLQEVEGETVELTIPAHGFVSSDPIGRRARAVSMRLSGGGMLSQSQHRFEYLGARVVVTHDGSAPPRLDSELFTPAIEDQLAQAPVFTLSADSPDAPGTFRFGDFFRAVNETGVAIPFEFEFRRSTDDDTPAFSMTVVLPAHGEALWPSYERYGAVTVIKPGRPMHADTPSKVRLSTGPIRIRDGRIIEHRVTENGAGGVTTELNEARD